MEQPQPTFPIINCHTHIFTVKDVPPMLARNIAPWPFHYMIRTGWIAGIVKAWTDTANRISRNKFYKKTRRVFYQFRMALKRYFILRLLKIIAIAWILSSLFHDTYTDLLQPWLLKQGIDWPVLGRLDHFLKESGFIVITNSWLIKALLLIVLLLLFPSGRNLVFFLFRQFNRFFKLLPGKQTSALLKRYVNIIRFANYKDQFNVLSRLRKQYPPGSKMVILPMDMEFMGAGKPPRPYHEQMAMLAAIKKNHEGAIFPFVFVDPRRESAGDKIFFDYSVENNKVVLRDCFIKDYIEKGNFSGFKIYPALGYFPFDEKLLPLWKYAADNGIPIMTHCIRGVIYYRGSKQQDWDHHPVFEQFTGSDKEPEDKDYKKMLLPQMKAVDVQEIFTHPMNYVCLYKKEFLAKLIAGAKDKRIKELFGYHPADGSISRGLGHLKLCFGHFGGEDEWAKFFEKDRANYGHQLVTDPLKGIDFLFTKEGFLSRDKQAQIWSTADWYSIICSLMLQHEHIYADISYILHGDLEILPLLRHTLQHPELKKRVLYGSDFYVVRNHKSDKNMLADIRSGLLEEEFEQIACKNPLAFLERGPVEEIKK